MPEKNYRVPAYLLIPHQRSASCPAMIGLPGSSKPGKDVPVGLVPDRPDRCGRTNWRIRASFAW